VKQLVDLKLRIKTRLRDLCSRIDPFRNECKVWSQIENG
jgi:hypothetical protein